MKLHATELLFGKNQALGNTAKIVILIILTLIVLTLISLHYPLLGYPSVLVKNSSQSSSDTADQDLVRARAGKKCDIYSGEWVPNSNAPYYTNTTCWAIHDHQNCMKYGRPDTEFMKWRWKPDDCELPIFNPAHFLELVRGKSMAFVGDSVGRNQIQSLICLLSRVEYPVHVSYRPQEKSKHWQYTNYWKYTNYSFTIASFWTAYLVKAKEADPNGLFNIYLDEFDKDWTNQIEEFDYVIISGGHWFYQPSMFYENGQLVGCYFCKKKNITDLTMYYGYRKAFRTALRAIHSLERYKGITFLRTFSPGHFETGIWNQGGNCVRRRPFTSNETHLEKEELELYMIQVEEFRAAERKGRERGLKFRLLDITQAMLLRPDGHPSRFGHWPQENVTLYNDCVHWCLPGPIDTWNDFLLQMLKMEADGRLHTSDRKMKIK
ncbi:hypothetical protein HHK36_015073 [Tetracentron sinense]|uniref:Trichome birefringence-like N-terminal domain-containing protein n=1 Tax=Tetracentron sinense TaxID=13715 RepID=A0A835DDA8_TETSI|nr:hypothetical protein HHK36_015073 [Tetracentron sinense]